MSCCKTHHTQGRYEARWRPGQEASLAPPGSNLMSFGSKCTELKNVAYLCHFLDFSAPSAVIRRPHSDSTPEELLPLAPPLRP